MKVIDRYRAENIGGLKLPKLKGHVKITLHNCRTGKNEVVEGDNIVTNAVRDIFANNYLGGINYGSLMPLWSKWFGGILCYENPHALDGNNELDPDNYYPQSNAHNPLIAHAGDTAPSSAAIIAEDRTRGYPLSIVKTDNSVSQTWEWGSEQGNGVISAVSLTHVDTGNAGLGNTSSAFRSFVPWSNISNLPNMDTGVNATQNILAQYDDNHGLLFYIGEDGDFRPYHTAFSTKKITVYIKHLAYKKAGLFDVISLPSDKVRSFTVTTSVDFWYQPSYYFDYENKRLWLFTNITGSSGYNTYWDKQHIQYTVIDCENGTEYAHGTITSDASDLAPVCMDWPIGLSDDRDCPSYFNIIRDGNYFYFPTSSMASPLYVTSKFDVNGLKKIRYTDSYQSSIIPLNEVSTQWGSMMKGGDDFIIQSGRVFNGNIGYTCGSFFGYSQNQYPGYTLNEPESISSYALSLGGHQSTSRPRCILANKMVNTTLFNLNEAVRKTAAKALQIQYTLTEVSGNE